MAIAAAAAPAAEGILGGRAAAGLFGGSKGEMAVNAAGLFGSSGGGNRNNSRQLFGQTNLKSAVQGWPEYHMDAGPSGGS